MTRSSLQRIMMIEDDPDIQAVARLALESIGKFAVLMCGAGREGLRDGPAFEPDLILLDVMMPGMDGPTTLQELRRLPQLAATPAIFLTARTAPHEIAAYRAMGVLDVLAKPFDPIALSSTIREIWRRAHPVEPVAELQALADTFAAQLPEQLARIEDAWAQAQRRWDPGKLEVLRRLSHSLHGSAATFGFKPLSGAAAALEQALPARGVGSYPGAGSFGDIDRLVAGLRAAADLSASRQPGGEAGMPGLPVQLEAHSPPARPRDDRLVVLMDAVAPDLPAQLDHFGYQVQIARASGDLRSVGEQPPPAAMIVCCAAGDSAALATASAIWTPAPPLVVVAEQANLATRLRAVRAGADAFFGTPLNPIALVDKLDVLTARGAHEPYRVLIVDDERAQAECYAAILRAAGMLTATVVEPLEVMGPLAEFRPDIILMDIYMPDCDGLELAAAIRQQQDYVGIPIVFLSAEANRDMQLEAMRLGGDDFITKPIKPDHLILAVSSRVERLRTLRQFMLRDSLTGLLNHTATKERLEVELARAYRQSAPLTFAIIDIDHFKLVNDTYGHPAGDLVLKSLARLLQQRLRRTDIIGRYGGEEFAVVLAGTDASTATRMLDGIRAGLAQVRQQAAGRSFEVTFSCGIAGFPAYSDAMALTDAADRALYDAKHAGRNRVVVAQG